MIPIEASASSQIHMIFCVLSLRPIIQVGQNRDGPHTALQSDVVHSWTTRRTRQRLEPPNSMPIISSNSCRHNGHCFEGRKVTYSVRSVPSRLYSTLIGAPLSRQASGLLASTPILTPRLGTCGCGIGASVSPPGTATPINVLS